MAISDAGETDDESDAADEGEDEAAPAEESPAAAPAASVAAAKPAPPPRPPFIAERTWRGLNVALGLAGLVLVNYLVIRPWCMKHHIMPFVDEDLACVLKAVLAFGTLSLWVWALVRRLSGRPFGKRTITYAAMALGGLGVLSYISSDDLGMVVFVHKWELFHYYLGSKYPEELGYKRLYVCAAVAQSEFSDAQREEVKDRKLRDLTTDIVEKAAPVLDHPEACKDHFSPERWKLFKRDVAWFRKNMEKDVFNDMQCDHGYNPTPVWTMSGHMIGALFPRVTMGGLTVLGSLDTVLFALTFFFIWWAFGTEICCLALVFWGTQYPADGYFTGGAFMRQDWLMFAVLGACALRKRRWALGGGALATSALLRVFPVFFFTGIVVVALTHLYKHKRFAAHHLRVFAGAAATSVVLVTASVGVAGVSAYPGFVEHITLHHGTPLTNNMGLGVLLSFTKEGRSEVAQDTSQVDDFAKWVTLHRAALAKRYPYFLALNGLFAVLLVAAARRVKTLWIAMGLGAIFAVSLPTLTCYYYSFFIVPVLLAKASRRVGFLALTCSGLSVFLFLWQRVGKNWDDRYTSESVVFLAFALIMLVGFAIKPRRPKVAAVVAAPASLP